MNVICLDPEMEYEDLTNNLQGCFIDLMGGDWKPCCCRSISRSTFSLERISSVKTSVCNSFRRS